MVSKFHIQKILLALCLGGFTFINTPLSATATVQPVKFVPASQAKGKQDKKSSSKLQQLKQSIFNKKSNTFTFDPKKDPNEQFPQQGGLPEFVATGNFQTIKGEGEGAGDTPIIKERGGMPEFNITGYASFFPVFANPSNSYYKGENSPSFVGKNVDIKSDAKTKFDETGIGFDFEGGLNAGASINLSKNLKAGASIEIQAVKDDFEVDKAYIYFDSASLGKLYCGNVKGADSTFSVGGQSLIGGGGGINGTILSNLDYATGVFVPRAVVGNANKASKIFISTRDFFGFRIGLGFTPDTKLHGHNVRDGSTGDSSNGNNAGCFMKGKDDKERPSGKNNLAIGLRYEQEIIPNLTVRGSFVFVTESTRKLKATIINCKKDGVVDANSKGTLFTDPVYTDANQTVINEQISSKITTKEIELNNTKSYQFSLGVTFKDFTISGEYLHCGKSRLPSDSAYKTEEGKIVMFPQFVCSKDGNAGSAWNIGVRYDWNKFAFACVYWNTSRQITKDESTKGHIFTGTVDYLFNPGFKIFLEVDYLNSKSTPFACTMHNLIADKKNAILKQSGFAVIAGCTLQF